MITFEDEGYATDTFFIEDNCIRRLLEEWEKYGKLIVAYDFDHTVNGTYEVDCNCNQMIELIRACKEMGCTLIVFTARPDSEHEIVKEYLREHDIPFDYFNENDPNADIEESRKIFYNIFFDDRCGLASAYQTMVKVLKERMKQKGMI